jgi:hypothetical protein
MRGRLIGCLSAAAALLALAPAASVAQDFTTPVKLAGPPSGGEPSIVTDPFGDAFVAGPQGIPSGANGNSGTGFWASRNDGSSFATGQYIGSYLGGGDDDLLFSKGTLFTADLEAAATEICKSADRGKTFTAIGPGPDPGNCTTINSGQAGPSDDRPWLTADPKGTLYLTYHEFVSAQPLAFRSDNAGGDLFANPCGPIITDPSIQANVPTDVTGGTLVARPVTDKAGNLYILFATTTQQQNAAASQAGQPSGTFSQLYLAVSHDHCQSFTDQTVFDGSQVGTNTVQFGDIFNDLAIDGAGNLYVIGIGAVGHTPYPTTTNAYLLSSTDHGQKWTKPALLDSTKSAHMLPAAVGGPKAGQLAIGYFRTANAVTEASSTSGKWTYATAQSANATAAKPAFTYRDVNPGYVYHNGQICNAGVLCGTPGQASDRSLLDFTSVALDSHNCPLFTFAGNPTGTPTTNASTNTFNYVTRQLHGCFNSSAAGSSKKHKAAKKHKARKKRAKHKSRA